MEIDGPPITGSSAPGSTLYLRFEIESIREDDLSEILNNHETLGASLEPEVGGRTVVNVYLSTDSPAIPDLRQELKTLGVHDTEVCRQEAEDWLASYREVVRPFAVGRSWWIDPHPQSPTQAPDGCQRLVIEPRMAFGTGSHQSTALMLMELESHPPEGLSILDVGTGSGILALAAQRLGAGLTVGFDLDVEAVMVARQIRLDQDFDCSPAYFAGSWRAIGLAAFDLVLCNMISEHFLPMAEPLRKLMSPGGSAVFSGILDSEADEVMTRLQAAGFKKVSVRTLDEWVAVRVVHSGVSLLNPNAAARGRRRDRERHAE